MTQKTWRSLIALAAASSFLAACVPNAPAGEAAGSNALNVDITDDACVVSAAGGPAGTFTFTLNNKGTVRNEFEILAEDQLRIVGERENLGPGTTVEYTIALEPGTYYTACKTNMVGALVGATQFVVEDSGVDVIANADDKDLIDAAVTNYTAYVADQAGQLLAETEKFAETYKAGKVDEAKKAYAATRMYYERIEPTAEAFGDIDPALDLREADWQEEGAEGEWMGWHVIEKDLWRPDGYAGLSDVERVKYADALVADTKRLYDLVYSPDFQVSLDEISNGAIALLEEVAISKISGEEEAFSHTDLWDFYANVEGAKVAFGNVESLAKKKDAELVAKINKGFDGMYAELDKYKDGDGFVSYDTVDEAGRKALADKLNALRNSLAKLTAVILS